MIFIYPAAISESVDRRYLPGIIKTLELYLLHHIAEAAANGEIRFYITQNRLTGKFSQIQMEAIDWDFESLGNPTTLLENANKFLMEAAIDGQITFLEKTISDIRDQITQLRLKYEDTLSRAADAALTNKPLAENLKTIAQQIKSELDQATKDLDNSRSDLQQLRNEKSRGRDSSDQKRFQVNQQKRQQRYQTRQSNIDKLDRERSQIDREKREEEREKQRRPAAAGGLGDLKLDTTGITDLRPTSITVSAKVTLIKHPTPITSDTVTEDRSIPIGVKIVPIIVSNVSDYYQILQNDLYTNKFSAFFRGSVRSVMGYIQKWFNPALSMFLNMFSDKQEFSLWKDMLYNKKSAVNASSIGAGERNPGYQKYSAALMVFSINDLSNDAVNFFNDPSKVTKLHKMGWNSFAIMNDPDQTMTFCSYFENGMCSKIPYSYLFHSLKASDLFKELDSLGKFTSRIVGNFKRRRIDVAESINAVNKVRNKNAKLFKEFKDIADGRTRSSADN